MPLTTSRSLLKRTIAKQLVLLIAVLLAMSPAVSSAHPTRPIHSVARDVLFQQEDGWVAIKTDDGILFVWNVRDLHFTLAVKDKDIKPLIDVQKLPESVRKKGTP